MRRPPRFATARWGRSRAGSIVRARGCRTFSPSMARTTSARIMPPAQFCPRAVAADQQVKQDISSRLKPSGVGGAVLPRSSEPHVALQGSSPQVRIVVPVPSQNFIRSRNLGHYRPKCGPKQDRNFNSLFGRENSLFFAENSLFTPKNFPACSTGRSNFVTAWLYQSSRAIGISHIRHDQAIGPDDTRQRIDGLNAVHVYLSKHSPRSETSLRTCGRRLLARRVPAEC